MKNIIQQPDLFGNEITIFYCKNEGQVSLGTITETNSEGFKAHRIKDNKVLYTIVKGKAIEFVIGDKSKEINQINLF